MSLDFCCWFFLVFRHFAYIFHVFAVCLHLLLKNNRRMMPIATRTKFFRKNFCLNCIWNFILMYHGCHFFHQFWNSFKLKFCCPMKNSSPENDFFANNFGPRCPIWSKFVLKTLLAQNLSNCTFLIQIGPVVAEKNLHKQTNTFFYYYRFKMWWKLNYVNRYGTILPLKMTPNWDFYLFRNVWHVWLGLLRFPQWTARFKWKYQLLYSNRNIVWVRLLRILNRLLQSKSRLPTSGRKIGENIHISILEKKTRDFSREVSI